MDPRLKKILIISGVLALVFFIALFIFNSRFRIIKTEPGLNPYPNSVGVMEIYFNKDLDAEGLNKRIFNNQDSVIYASFGGRNKASVEKNKLTISFQELPAEGTHTIELKNINTPSGESITKNLTINIAEVKYEDLSKRAKEIYDEQSNLGEELPPQFPILKDLPYNTDNYQITYRPVLPDNDGRGLTLVITIKHFKPGNNADPATPEQTAEYLAKLRKYRNEALTWIKSKGYNIDDYTLTYSEPELREEFPSGLQQP